MLDYSGLQGGISLVILLVLLVVKGYALIDCIGRNAGDFVAAGTLQKQGWLIILALSLLAHVFFPDPLALLNLVGTVASLVYLAQLKGSGY